MLWRLSASCVLSSMLPSAAASEPVKLSSVASDRSVLYRAVVQPFDAVVQPFDAVVQFYAVVQPFDAAVKIAGQDLIEIDALERTLCEAAESEWAIVRGRC
jgi:hypothetical protein